MTKNEKLAWAIGAAIAVGFAFTVVRHGRQKPGQNQNASAPMDDGAATDSNKGLKKSVGRGAGSAEKFREYEAHRIEALKRLAVLGENKHADFHRSVSQDKQKRIMNLLAQISANPKGPDAEHYLKQLKHEMNDVGVKQGVAAWGQYLNAIAEENQRGWDSLSAEQQKSYGVKAPNLATKEQLEQARREKESRLRRVPKGGKAK